MTLRAATTACPARRAYELGLVDELVSWPADDRAALAGSPSDRPATRRRRGALEAGGLGRLERVPRGRRVRLVARAHALVAPDFTEGPRAFAEKREPQWNDRSAG